MQNSELFFSTARERYRILLKKMTGHEWPWTEDPVFRQWSFCNVHREDDRTTKWFRHEIASRLLSVSRYEQARAALIFRWFNRISTGEEIKDLLLGDWNSDEAYERLHNSQIPVFTGAYVIRSPDGMSKLEGVLKVIDYALPRLMPMVFYWGESLQRAWIELQTLPYVGSFTSYEVVTDLRWTPVLGEALDINTWAAAGPGCARGLGRVVSGHADQFNYNSSRDQDVMLGFMRDLLSMSRDSRYWPQTWTRWEMREVEHWACEFDKYQRAASGERLKRRYQQPISSPTSYPRKGGQQ